MLGRPSLSTRVTRALVAVITVWCLGCAGYEPLLDSLHGDGTAMSCGEMTVSGGTAGVEQSMPAVSAVSASHDAFDCGCGQGCHASSPAVQATHPVRSAIPALAALERSAPPSVTRTPLLPPPETGRL